MTDEFDPNRVRFSFEEIEELLGNRDNPHTTEISPSDVRRVGDPPPKPSDTLGLRRLKNYALKRHLFISRYVWLLEKGPERSMVLAAMADGDLTMEIENYLFHIDKELKPMRLCPEPGPSSGRSGR